VASESATQIFEPYEVRAATLLTDGAARAVDPYELMTWTELLGTIDISGPATLVRSVREAEATVQSTERWPRSKPSDDAAVAYALLT
jgi:hypothetical protein